MMYTKKLLYILPDTAYIAELLAGKKPHTFVVQAFHQVNGEFMNDDEFLVENIEKLIKKIDPETYHVILPDYLFTNTIVDVAETADAAVKDYLKNTLLNQLNLSKDTHELDTFILTQHQGKTKVQLSAVEKELLEPLRRACQAQRVIVDEISPLSWTVKSLISLEPSLSLIQMGSRLYLAQHYIGIDQATSFAIEDIGHVMDAVKTLKGAEPNIQTMYLLTNPLVESQLKEQLSGTLPLQQLAVAGESQEGMPAFVKQIIEAGAKTLDVQDYPVPKFSLGTTNQAPAVTPADASATVQAANVMIGEPPEVNTTLPLPSALPSFPAPAETTVPPAVLEPTRPTPVVTPVTPVSTPVTPPAPAILSVLPPAKPAILPSEPSAKPDPVDVQPALTTQTTPSASMVSEKLSSFSIPLPAPAETSNVQLPPASVVTPTFSALSSQPTFPAAPAFSPPLAKSGSPVSSARPVIKNTNDTSHMLKMVGITFGALIVTVVIGLGIGLGLLRLTERSSGNVQGPVVSVAPQATASPVPSPSPTPVASTVNKTTIKLLVVNATKITGKAGKTKSTLTAAGYKSIDTGNAKGLYEDPGTYFLGSNEAVKAELEKDLELTLTSGSAEELKAEDSAGAYDGIIVINE